MEEDALQETLLHGEIELQGQFVLGYNYTFLVRVSSQGHDLQAVYKPRQGEQPLWDFPPDSLSQREVAAYLVSRAIGWNLVPVTVLRETGPFGAGSLQQYIEYDPGYHYFTFSPEDRDRLRPVALFDLLVNNADRKGGHILLDGEKKFWLIDHGLCFHEEDKLRTVIWDFAGQPIIADLLEALQEFLASLGDPSGLQAKLAGYLNPSELTALQARCAQLLAEGSFPHPPGDRRAFPYPPI
jgi:uncharacterized repeat protein (TIGR03843 family)